ncbi:hypothetical protein GQR58_000355 [Nymphon striatum]|nr:hypothetical protein GQR58_000355 [Nymphon striatum]
MRPNPRYALLHGQKPFLGRAWPKASDGDLWSRAAISALRGHGKALPQTVPRDIGNWCPAYPQATVAQREAFWVGLMSTLAKHESTYRPTANAQDIVVGKAVCVVANMAEGRVQNDSVCNAGGMRRFKAGRGRGAFCGQTNLAPVWQHGRGPNRHIKPCIQPDMVDFRQLDTSLSATALPMQRVITESQRGCAIGDNVDQKRKRRCKQKRDNPPCSVQSNK